MDLSFSFSLHIHFRRQYTSHVIYVRQVQNHAVISKFISLTLKTLLQFTRPYLYYLIFLYSQNYFCLIFNWTGIYREKYSEIVKARHHDFKDGNITTPLESNLSMCSKIENLNVYISPKPILEIDSIEILVSLYNKMCT